MNSPRKQGILNVAIIGQGRSGRDIHGAYFLSEASKKYYRVIAVVDALAARRARAANEFGFHVYDDYKLLFAHSDIDLVINATFSDEHYPITMDLLEHGFNVVCEKPFSAYADECEAMIRAAKEHNCLLTVFQQSRLASYYKRIHEIIESGVLGEIAQISIAFSGFSRRWDWQTSKRFYGGSLLNTGPHPLDQALDLLNLAEDELPQVVYSKLGKYNSFGDAEDYAKVLLTAPGRPLIDVEISSCDAYSDYTYKIQGSRGSLKATMSKLEWKYFDPIEAPEQKLTFETLVGDDGYSPQYCGERLPWHCFAEELNGTAFGLAVEDYYERLYKTMTEGAELFIKPEAVVKLIRVAERVHADNPMPVLY